MCYCILLYISKVVCCCGRLIDRKAESHKRSMATHRLLCDRARNPRGPTMYEWNLLYEQCIYIWSYLYAEIQYLFFACRFFHFSGVNSFHSQSALLTHRPGLCADRDTCESSKARSIRWRPPHATRHTIKMNNHILFHGYSISIKDCMKKKSLSVLRLNVAQCTVILSYSHNMAL